MLVRIVSLLIGYAFGLFQTSYIYGRKNGIDIREHGSGNAGTTNALRTLGKKAGAVTFWGTASNAPGDPGRLSALRPEATRSLSGCWSCTPEPDVSWDITFPSICILKEGKGSQPLWAGGSF